jgi:signal transduction histidine kinase
VGNKYFYDLFVPDQRENLKQAAFAAFSRNESIKGFVNENVHKDGRIVILETNGIPIFDAAGTLLGYRGADKDITERKRAEKELANSREQLRALSRYLQAAREEERTFIAREIHDELGQELTALKMDLAWLVKQLPQDQSLLVQKTAAMSEMVDDTIQTVRRVASQLRPGMLDDLGLVAALEWQAGEFQSRTGIICKLDLPENLTTLGKDQATAMFRIFQETLTNITRHAHATKVMVSLKELPEGIDLVVRDNGVGITEDQLNDPRSLGLTGMRERVQAFGGTLHFKILNGKGTSVRLRMPLVNKQLEKEA